MPGSTSPPTVPYGCKAYRPTWDELPAAVRGVFTDRIGPVVSAHTAGGGFTPAFAGLLTASDGSRHFLKAAAVGTLCAGWNEREADVIAALPARIPAPRVRRTARGHGWFLLCLEPIDGRMPHQPWHPHELTAALEAQTVISQQLARPPAGLRELMRVPSFAQHAAENLTLLAQRGPGPRPDAGYARLGCRPPP